MNQRHLISFKYQDLGPPASFFFSSSFLSFSGITTSLATVFNFTGIREMAHVATSLMYKECAYSAKTSTYFHTHYITLTSIQMMFHVNKKRTYFFSITRWLVHLVLRLSSIFLFFLFVCWGCRPRFTLPFLVSVIPSCSQNIVLFTGNSQAKAEIINGRAGVMYFYCAQGIPITCFITSPNIVLSID